MVKKTGIIFLILCSVCSGAENISTGGSGGGRDYSSLGGWYGAVEGDITAGNAEVLECYDDGAVIDGGASGTFTTDADSYVSIRAANGEETDGVGGGATLGNGMGDYITNVTGSLDDFYLQDMTLLLTSSSNMISVTSGADILIERCFFDGDGNNTGQNYCLNVSGSATITIRNSIFIANEATATDQGHGIHTFDASQTLVVDNCTFIGWDDGVENDGGTITCQNVITFRCTDGFDGTITKTTCISDVAGDANSQTTQTLAQLFTDGANKDFSVVDNSSDLYDAGTDLSGTFTDDITGYTRVQWDVGAFELQEEAEAPASGTRPRARTRNWSYIPDSTKYVAWIAK